MLNKALLSALLVLSLTGCAVYGGGYDRGYQHGHNYRYHDGYRRDYHSPPVYVVPRHYDNRRHDARGYAPPPPPRYHGYQQPRDQRWQHQPPKHEPRRSYHAPRQHQPSAGQHRGTWDGPRSVQQREPRGRHQNGGNIGRRY